MLVDVGIENEESRSDPFYLHMAHQLRRGARKKDPSAPKRPLSAYNLFFRDLKEALTAKGPAVKKSFEGLGKYVGKEWRKLGEEERKRYEQMAEVDRRRYHREMAVYEGREEELEGEDVEIKEGGEGKGRKAEDKGGGKVGQRELGGSDTRPTPGKGVAVAPPSTLAVAPRRTQPKREQSSRHITSPQASGQAGHAPPVDSVPEAGPGGSQTPAFHPNLSAQAMPTLVPPPVRSAAPLMRVEKGEKALAWLPESQQASLPPSCPSGVRAGPGHKAAGRKAAATASSSSRRPEPSARLPCPSLGPPLPAPSTTPSVEEKIRLQIATLQTKALLKQQRRNRQDGRPDMAK